MDYIFLEKTPLFRGASALEIETMLACLGAEVKKFPRGATVLMAGDVTESLGLVLSGSVSIENDDAWGNKSILGRAERGEVFAETYACVPGAKLMISAVAAEDCEILFLRPARILHPCENACSFHTALVRNLLFISSAKNLQLSRRIFHTSAKSIRGRLLSYLSHEATARGSRDFTIPFNRQQLADYLSVDRSALSNELSKMQREGLITFHRSHFTLLHTEEY